MAAPARANPNDHGTPYADAVAGNAAQDLLRLNVPGHSADHGSAPELMDYFGADVLKRHHEAEHDRK